MDDSDLDRLLAGVDADLDDVLQRTQAETDAFLKDFAQTGDGKTIHGETRTTRRDHLRMARLLRRAGEAYFEHRGRKPPFCA